jgi:transcription initiation factor TFIIA large subunit
MGLGSTSVAGFAKLSKYAKSSPPIAKTPPIEVKPKIEPSIPRAGGNGNAGGSRGVPDENGLLPGDEIIDSDLDDDSEDDDQEDGEGSDADEEEDTDYVLCVYDKVRLWRGTPPGGWSVSHTANVQESPQQVQRVKNKWKTTFKDGLIHVNGKDYLFSKCNGYVYAILRVHRC